MLLVGRHGGEVVNAVASLLTVRSLHIFPVHVWVAVGRAVVSQLEGWRWESLALALRVVNKLTSGL